MALDYLLGRTAFSPRLLALEKATLAYALLTALLTIPLWARLVDPLTPLVLRAAIVAGLLFLWCLFRVYPSRLTLLARCIYPLALLAVWYPDTYAFCSCFPYLDHLFAKADLVLFGCQPALVWSVVLKSKWCSELFYLGYYAYYPMIFLTVLAPLFVKRTIFLRTAFIVGFAFFCYYLIYLFLPVAGPQYYFPALSQGAIESGAYPALGDYFRYHTEMAVSPGPEGLFRSLVEGAQAGGERPTAAFPSSHVGMSTVMMILLWRTRHSLALSMLPLYILLCGATVYIQAHYLVDVLAGWITAPLFLLLAQWAYRHCESRAVRQDQLF